MATKTYQTRHGPMLAFAGAQYMTPTLEKQGEYAPEEWALLEQLVRPRMTVVEIGANIGVHSVPLARSCGRGRRGSSACPTCRFTCAGSPRSFTPALRARGGSIRTSGFRLCPATCCR